MRIPRAISLVSVLLPVAGADNAWSGYVRDDTGEAIPLP